MRTGVILAVCLFGIAIAEFNQFLYCNGGTVLLKGNNGQLGCSGYTSGNTIFNITNSKPIFVTIRNFTADYYSTLYISTSNGNYRYSASAPPSFLNAPAGFVTFTWYSPYTYNQPYGFYALVTDSYYPVSIGQPSTLTAAQPGGFLYFVTPALSYGSVLNVKLSVNTYSGFLPPALFIGLNYLPLLSFYNYYNTTTSTSAHPVVTITVKNPPAAVYMLGVFLYGSSSSISVTAAWNYTFNSLGNGQTVNTDTNTNQFYQLTVPAQTAVLNLKVSRQLPGGYVVVYVGTGFLPTTSSYSYVMDTSQQSYIQLTIKKPYNTTASTPGLYVLNFQSKFGGDAGYIFQASWGSSLEAPVSEEEFVAKNNKRTATVVYDNES